MTVHGVCTGTHELGTHDEQTGKAPLCDSKYKRARRYPETLAFAANTDVTLGNQVSLLGQGLSSSTAGIYRTHCEAPILQPLSPSYRPDNYLRPQLQKWFHHSSLLFPAPSVLIAHTTATSASPPCFSTPRSQTLSPSPRRYFLRHSCSTGCSLASVSWICDSIRRHHNEKSSHH